MKLLLESWKSFIKESITFDEATNNWFYITLDDSDIPEHILDVLEKNAIKVYSSCHYKTDCGDNSYRWNKIFKKNNIKSELVSGAYISPSSNLYADIVGGKIEVPMSADHVWLIVEDNILFDPTAGQFKTHISIDGYLDQTGKPLYKKSP